jgi:hypothetical protein
MSDYTKSTNFTVKDTLPTGNSGKIVKGTELDIEFTGIASAISSKADISSPALLGTPTAPTASSGTNTTQLATTAFVTTALSAVYPVGSIYINAGVSTNPATLLGFGTWTAFGAGKVLVGLNASDASFDTLEKTGGSKDSVVVSHTHTGTTAGAGSHNHRQGDPNQGGGSYYGMSDTTGAVDTPTNRAGLIAAGPAGGTYLTDTVANHTHAVTIDSTGSSGTNANLQPYITVNMWKRTA